MIWRLAVRSLATRPLRTAVLAIGFGLGVAVMAELLGVGEVILEQAHSPALAGGGDLVVTGAIGPVDSARNLLANVLGANRFRTRLTAASPSRRATLYLVAGELVPGIVPVTLPVSVRGGVPSLERAVGDPEVTQQTGWIDEPADAGWTRPPPGDVLRAMDRFHPIPRDAGSDGNAGVGFSRTSWAEWLYFNGKTADGRLRFYLTFLAAGVDVAGKRPLFVRLQLERDGKTTNYSTVSQAETRDLLNRAPNLDAGGNHVRLDGSQYRLTLALPRERSDPQSAVRNPQSQGLSGEITLDAAPGRSLPPATIHGARGWVSGYVVPVLSGTFHGALHVDGENVSVDGSAGYHDHNWGFWEGVRWQWGQVAGGDVSIVYGRVFPPASVADSNRIPGFLGVLGPDGPIAFSTNVSIHEDDERGKPHTIAVHARGPQLDITLQLDVTESMRTKMSMTRGDGGDPMGFLQLGGVYTVSGRAAGRDLDFSARGSAETFRPVE